MKTIIIAAAQGTGKSIAIHRLIEKFGTRQVVDGWDGYSMVPDGALVLTNCEPSYIPDNCEVWSLGAALA